jgi:hypothetical protein
VFSESFSSVVDGFSSVVDPNQIFLGDLNFFLNVFSVFSGGISGGFVGISDRGKVFNHVSVNSFVGSVDFVMFGLSINIGLFEGSEKVKSRLNGIDGSGLHVDEVSEGGLQLWGGHGNGYEGE